MFLLLLSDGGRVGRGGRGREAETSDNDNDQQHLVRGHNRGNGHNVKNLFPGKNFNGFFAILFTQNLGVNMKRREILRNEPR